MTRRSAPRSPVGGVLALLLLFSSPGFAHDLWILPGKYRLRADEVTRVFVNNGDVFPESLTLLGKERLSEVLSVSSAGELPISDFRVDGKSLTFDFQSAAPGSHVIVLGTRPRTVRMKGEVFEDYLGVEGLTALAAIREELGQTSGGARGRRVLLEGEPLAGVSVPGARASSPAKEISATTDERGEAAVTVTAPGRWYVRAIHMIRLEGAPEASWASYWATLSFEVQSTAGSGY